MLNFKVKIYSKYISKLKGSQLSVGDYYILF